MEFDKLERGARAARKAPEIEQRAWQHIERQHGVHHPLRLRHAALAAHFDLFVSLFALNFCRCRRSSVRHRSGALALVMNYVRRFFMGSSGAQPAPNAAEDDEDESSFGLITSPLAYSRGKCAWRVSPRLRVRRPVSVCLSLHTCTLAHLCVCMRILECAGARPAAHTRSPELRCFRRGFAKFLVSASARGAGAGGRRARLWRVCAGVRQRRHTVAVETLLFGAAGGCADLAHALHCAHRCCSESVEQVAQDPQDWRRGERRSGLFGALAAQSGTAVRAEANSVQGGQRAG